MKEIICPNCKTPFKIDETSYADITKQIRDHQFEEELDKRLILAENEKQNAIKLAEANLKNKLQEDLVQKEKELTEKLTLRENEIAQIKSQLENAEVQKKLSITEAVQKIEKERDSLANEVKTKELEKQNLESSLKQQFSIELQNKDAIIKYKDDEIARVKDWDLVLNTYSRCGNIFDPSGQRIQLF